MSGFEKCDKCKRVHKKYTGKEIWVDGSISPDSFLVDLKTRKRCGYVGHFDLCPKCARPLLGYMKKFFKR